MYAKQAQCKLQTTPPCDKFFQSGISSIGLWRRFSMNMILAILVLVVGGYLIWKNKGVHPDLFELIEGEEIVEIVKGDHWEKGLLGKKQKSGEFAITNKRLLFKGTVLASCDTDIKIDYNEISSIDTSMTPPCFPFGITVSLANGDKYQFAVLKRKRYYDLITSVCQNAAKA